MKCSSSSSMLLLKARHQRKNENKNSKTNDEPEKREKKAPPEKAHPANSQHSGKCRCDGKWLEESASCIVEQPHPPSSLMTSSTDNVIKQDARKNLPFEYSFARAFWLFWCSCCCWLVVCLDQKYLLF